MRKVRVLETRFLLTGLGLKDYNDIIKTPMDLGTIRKNLKANKYKNIEDMLADVQLVWDNCKEYNAEGSVNFVLSTPAMQFWL